MSCGHHHHSDHHHHEHASDSPGRISEHEKLVKMLEHWIHHNEDHAKSFRDWADKARGMGRDDVAHILEEVAEGARGQNQSLEKALAMLASAV